MVIAFHGLPKSGKDTATKITQILVDNPDIKIKDVVPMIKNHSFIGGKFEVKRFGDKLKEAVALVLGCSSSDLNCPHYKDKILPEKWWIYSQTKKTVKPTVRDFLKLFAEDACRQKVHENIWVNATMREYKKGLDWVIPDLRYRNELEYLQENVEDLLLVKILRKGAEKSKHKSDNDLDHFSDFEYTIENKDIVDFIFNIKRMLIIENLI